VTAASGGHPADPGELAAALEAAGYLPDEGLATAAYLALRMHRPLFLEGDAGVGKTSLALALADVLRAELVRLQCYEGIDAAQALYDWDFPRQVLHLRAAEAASDGRLDQAELERSLYDRRYLVARPILRSIEHSPSVLLVDEIDRADDEFEAFLLEVLADNAVTIPELGTIRAEVPPLVVLTSNRTREVHDALKRRRSNTGCHIRARSEVAILRRRRRRYHRAARADRRRCDQAAWTPISPSRQGSPSRSTGPRPCTCWELASPDPNGLRPRGAVLKYQEDAVRARNTVLAELPR
jgi:MoxR-like ATPase